VNVQTGSCGLNTVSVIKREHAFGVKAREKEKQPEKLIDFTNGRTSDFRAMRAIDFASASQNSQARFSGLVHKEPASGSPQSNRYSLKRTKNRLSKPTQFRAVNENNRSRSPGFNMKRRLVGHSFHEFHGGSLPKGLL